MRLHSTVFLALALAAACSNKDDDAGGGGGGSGAGDSGSSDSGSGGGSGFDNPPGSSGSGSGTGTGEDDGGTGSGPTGVIDDPWETPPELQLCDGACQCTDGIDNDGDGVADGFDAECTGGNDNDEGTFATGIPGDNMDPKWQDCFFDGDSGAGNDGCRYATECLTGELPDDHQDCTVTQMCIEFCQPRTPNGCDCFGCCTFTSAGGDEISVILTADCEEENLDQCTSCQPAPADGCSNECGRCELCPGRTIDDLPDDCGSEPPPPSDGGVAGSGGVGGSDAPPPPGYECEGGLQVCTDTRDCQTGYFCSFGCCLVVVR